MSERERFERWAQTQQWALDRCPRYGHYLVSHIEWQWQAWQARARISEQEKAELLELLEDAIKALPVNHKTYIRARALIDGGES